jgi:hypothetical protein
MDWKTDACRRMLLVTWLSGKHLTDFAYSSSVNTNLITRHRWCLQNVSPTLNAPSLPCVIYDLLSLSRKCLDPLTHQNDASPTRYLFALRGGAAHAGSSLGRWLFHWLHRTLNDLSITETSFSKHLSSFCIPDVAFHSTACADMRLRMQCVVIST